MEIKMEERREGKFKCREERERERDGIPDTQ